MLVKSVINLTVFPNYDEAQQVFTNIVITKSNGVYSASFNSGYEDVTFVYDDDFLISEVSGDVIINTIEKEFDQQAFDSFVIPSDVVVE